MKLTFSQGIVTHATSDGTTNGPQNFLIAIDTNSKVTLNTPVSPAQAFQLAFAHRDTNYLLTVRTTVDGAWGSGNATTPNNVPFTDDGGTGNAANEYYLYVDLDLATGLTSYGWSKYRPVNQSTSPSSPSATQHWYDTGNKIMYEWNDSGAGRWVETVRSFVAQYIFGGGGNSFTSLSANSPSYIGTTVGISNGSYNAGSLVFDLNGDVLQRVDTNNKTVFFTTEDVFYTGLPTSSKTVLESFVSQGIAQEPVAAYQPMYFSALNQLSVLKSTHALDEVIFGIMEHSVGLLELGKITTSGVVNNAGWSWTDVNEQIYADENGNLVSNERDGYNPVPGQKPIAVAIDATTILLRASELLLSDSGLDQFTELSDTPNSYVDNALQLVRVNTAEDALEFGAEMKNLTDVDSSMTKSGGNILYVRNDNTLWDAADPGGTSGVQAWDQHLDQIAALSAATDTFIVGSSNSWVSKTKDEVKTILAYVINDMGDVDTTGLSAVNNILRWDGASNFVPYADSNYIQDVFKTVTGDSGSAIAVGTTDTINISGGTNITTTAAVGSPAETLVIDWVPAALGELSDVNLTGSPLPAENDVITRVGSEWVHAPVPAAAVQALPRPYDFAAQSFGEVGSDAIMFRYIAPRDFILYDYGHQADSETRPPSDMDFSVTLNGTEIGIFRYFQSGDSTVAFNFVNPEVFTLTSGSADGSPVVGVTQHAVSKGDILKILSPLVGSPPSAISGFEDVSITLRGVVEPVIPIGSLSATLTVTGSPTAGVSIQTLGLNITGEATYIEYAVIAYSADGSTWYPMDDPNGSLTQTATDGFQWNNEPGTPRLTSESDYVVTTDTSPVVEDFTNGVAGIRARIQATVFGPAGVVTTYVDVEF